MFPGYKLPRSQLYIQLILTVYTIPILSVEEPGLPELGASDSTSFTIHIHPLVDNTSIENNGINLVCVDFMLQVS